MAQKHLILILARELASNLATPTLITDENGTVVFYNEAAETVIGGPFAEIGEVGIDSFGGELRSTDGRRRAAGGRRACRAGSRSTSAARRTCASGSRAGTESTARCR